MAVANIAQALTAFAEERVKEERERFDKECTDKKHVHFKCHVIENSNANIRAEAFEVAARICDGPVNEPLTSRRPGYFLAAKIRALKEKP